MKNNNYHESVMVQEVLSELHLEKFANVKIIDATLGTAGHSLALMEAGCEVLGIEADPKMLSIAKDRVPSGIFVLGNFVNIDRIAKENNFIPADAVLFDLGVSNLHLKEDDRGFSFSNPDQDLDMRLNPNTQGVTASDLLNALDKTQLTGLFNTVMKYPDARRLAGEILVNRPIKTIGELSEIVGQTRLLAKQKNLNEMTLPMLALRIAVNSELDNLEKALSKSYQILKPGGKLLVITFHSGEEKIVTRFGGKQKTIKPSYEEIEKNPRSRSAVLRVVEKK